MPKRLDRARRSLQTVSGLLSYLSSCTRGALGSYSLSEDFQMRLHMLLVDQVTGGGPTRLSADEHHGVQRVTLPPP
jgi:hypothetical protein